MGLGPGGVAVRKMLGLGADFGTGSVGSSSGLFAGGRIYIDSTGTPTLVFEEAIVWSNDGTTPGTMTLAEIDVLFGAAAEAVLPPPGASDETWQLGIDPAAVGGPAWVTFNPSSTSQFVFCANVTIPAGDPDVTHWTIDNQTGVVPGFGFGLDGTLPTSASKSIAPSPPSLVTSGTLVDYTGLVFAVGIPAGFRTYQFHFEVAFESANVGTGLKLGLTHGSVVEFAATVRIPSGAGAETIGTLHASGDSVEGLTVAATNTIYVATIDGAIQAAAPGLLQVQYAAGGVAGANLTPSGLSYGVLSGIFPPPR